MAELIPTALYARYSSDNQRSESIDAQVRAIEEYANRNGYTIVARYIDEALTATTDDRASFQKMIEDSRSGAWRYLIVHKLDRFARNKYDSVFYKRQLKINGVRVLSVTENLDDSPESAMLESVLEGMAEYYSRNLSREVKKGLRENAHNGKLTGGFPPIGYDVDEEGHYIINEEEADTVRLIYKWTLDGKGYKAIAQALNSMDRTTRAGNAFSPNSIHDILRNEKYKGVLIHSKYVKGVDGKRKRHNAKLNDNTLYLPDTVPVIVSFDTWTSVNELMDARKGWGRGHAKRDYMLSGLIFCGECSAPMEGQHVRDSYFYRCACKKRDSASCGSSKINADVVEQEVLRLLRSQLLNKRSIKTIVPKLSKEATRKATDSACDALVLQERITEIGLQTTRLVETIMAMGGSATIQAKLKELENEKAQISRTLIDAELETRVYSTAEDEIADILYGDMEALEDKETASISQIIHRYIRRVTVSFDPNDPPRSGHRRNATIDIKAVLTRKNRPSTGTSKDVLMLHLFSDIPRE